MGHFIGIESYVKEVVEEYRREQARDREYDRVIDGLKSKCCDSYVLQGDICGKCKEGCEVIDELEMNIKLIISEE